MNLEQISQQPLPMEWRVKKVGLGRVLRGVAMVALSALPGGVLLYFHTTPFTVVVGLSCLGVVGFAAQMGIDGYRIWLSERQNNDFFRLEHNGLRYRIAPDGEKFILYRNLRYADLERRPDEQPLSDKHDDKGCKLLLEYLADDGSQTLHRAEIDFSHMFPVNVPKAWRVWLDTDAELTAQMVLLRLVNQLDALGLLLQVHDEIGRQAVQKSERLDADNIRDYLQQRKNTD